MSAPTLYLGQRGGGKLLRVGEGTTDDGLPILFRAVPNVYAPAGVDGECAFYVLWLVVTHTDALTLRIVPILDGARLDSEIRTVELAAPATPGQPVSTPLEIPLVQDAIGADGATTVARHALRGTWLTFLIDTPLGLGEGFLEVESLTVEFEVVRESKRTVP